MLSISAGEYRTRLERLESAVEKAGLHVFLVSSFDSIYYLTGAGFEPLERPFFLAVFPRGVRGPALLVPRLDAEHMRKARNVAEIKTYWEYPAPKGRRWIDGLEALIGEAQCIGIEPSLRRDIADELERARLTVLPLVEQLRLVKSPDEVAMIRRSASYADRGVEKLICASYFGATAAEGLAQSGALGRLILCDVDNWEVLTTRVLMATWAAPRSARPHSIPDLNDRLHGGPHVALALLRVNGYAAESERTFFTSTPSSDEKRAFRAMAEARGIAMRMIRPGLACGELNAKVNEFLRTEGFAGEERRLHRTGHGIGLGNHEAPWLAEGSDDVLAENMVISIEPGIYLEGLGGFRHSDTILVTRDGAECLTHAPIDIDSLTLRGWRPIRRLRGAMVRRAMGLKAKARASAMATVTTGSMKGQGAARGTNSKSISQFSSPEPCKSRRRET
jgi:Xaa-Pro aminopeptidase